MDGMHLPFPSFLLRFLLDTALKHGSMFLVVTQHEQYGGFIGRGLHSNIYKLIILNMMFLHPE